MRRIKIDTKETENVYIVVEVYGKYPRKITNLIGKYSRPVTVLFAFITLLIGIAAVFFQVKTIGGVGIEWFRLPMSAMTFFAAMITFSRVVRMSAHGSGQGKLSANLSIREPDE